MSQLKVLIWNANGIRGKRNELEQFVSHKNVDVILLNETRLDSGTAPKIYGYTSYDQWEYCNAVFVDIQEAFDRVWHTGLLTKLKTIFPAQFNLMLHFYLNYVYFQIKMRRTPSELNATRKCSRTDALHTIHS